jgi:hypothetical protein
MGVGMDGTYWHLASLGPFFPPGKPRSPLFPWVRKVRVNKTSREFRFFSDFKDATKIFSYFFLKTYPQAHYLQS